MNLPIYQIDAFTNHAFGGNPACVVPLKEWLPKEVMLQIAEENAVAETAFFIVGEDKIKLRWFTPEIEMDLCGHATLATAHCLKSILGYADDMVFDTESGDLHVTESEGWYSMDFPSRMPEPAELLPNIVQALSIQPKAVFKSRDYVLLYDSEEEVRSITIDRNALDQVNLDPGGVIVTAVGNEADFVSRFFTPQASILEDPVTGSAHCSLIPFWAHKLDKEELLAHQVSARHGVLRCKNAGNRVIISGQARTFLKGEIEIDFSV